MFSPSALLTRALQLFLGLHDLNDPVASLGGVTVTGSVSGNLTHSFLGIPFASAPRFDLPVPIESYSENFFAQEYGPACIQQDVLKTATPAAIRYLNMFNLTGTIPVPEIQDEECKYPCRFFTSSFLSSLTTFLKGLSVNVIRPHTANKNSQLPVLLVSSLPVRPSPHTHFFPSGTVPLTTPPVYLWRRFPFW